MMECVNATGAGEPAGEAKAPAIAGCKVARARHALALAEARAWSGASLQVTPVDGATMVHEVVHEVVHEMVHETNHEMEVPKTRSQRSPGRSGRGKKQRVRQCARDVKHFLAQRDAGADGARNALWNVDRERMFHESGERLCRDVSASSMEDARLAGLGNLEAFAPTSSCARGRMAAWTDVPRIALGDAACDEALGGGLVCGAVHEIRGVCCVRSAEANGETRASRRFRHFRNPRRMAH